MIDIRTHVYLRLAFVGTVLFVILAVQPLRQHGSGASPFAQPASTAVESSPASVGMFSVPVQTLKPNSTVVESEPRIRIAIPSLDAVENKLKWLIELSSDPQLRKQWKKLKEDFIDAFTDGVATDKPLSMDIVFSPQGLVYELRIPISDLTDERTGFLPGLRGRNYRVKSLGEGTYEILEKDTEPARMRYDKNYAWIATGNRPVPAKREFATADLMPLLDRKKDVIAEVKNNSEDIALRRASFESFRSRAEGSNRKRRSESPNAFEWRKLLLKAMLNEAERLLVEAEQLQVSWITDSSAANSFGRGEVSLAALAGTQLCATIEEIGTKPSYFANVKPHENPLAAANVSLSLNASDRDQLKALFKSLRPILESEIGIRSPKTGREELSRATSIFVDMLEEGAELRSVDAFIELFAAAPNKNTLLCGIRAANGKKADEIVKLIQSIRTDWKLKPDADKHADVHIHELTIGKQDLPFFQCVFPGEDVVYIGTGKNAVWVAAGAGSLAQLKTAVDLSNKPPPEKFDPVVICYQLQVDKLVSLFDSLQMHGSTRNVPLTESQRQLRKDIDKYVKLAREATSHCDSSMRGELRRVGNKIEGFADLNKCTLKCVGAMLAGTLKDLE